LKTILDFDIAPSENEINKKLSCLRERPRDASCH